MKTAIRIERDRGYPFVRKILEVISSRTASPNISRPMTAMLTSRRYCHQLAVAPYSCFAVIFASELTVDT